MAIENTRRDDEEAAGDPGYRGRRPQSSTAPSWGSSSNLAAISNRRTVVSTDAVASPRTAIRTVLRTGVRVEVLLRAPAAERPAELFDPGPWERYGIVGTGSPPFPREPIDV